MAAHIASADVPSRFTVLVTGVNSGLGFAICCRLIDEFLTTRPQTQTLHLLFSTRDARKSSETLTRLEAHLHQTLKRHESRLPGAARLLAPRIVLEGVQADLLKFTTLRDLATQLCNRNLRIDAVVWNAGIANWLGLNWFRATWLILTDLIHTITYPSYLLCEVGTLAAEQNLESASSLTQKSHAEPEPKLGRVFTANVFGHYLLTHWLRPAMHADSRIVWISSISAVAETFRIDDLQGLTVEPSYEASKRLTDLLVLTSDLPSTQPYVNEFLSSSSEKPSPGRPKMFVTHPGVVGTSIADLHPILEFFMFLALHLARILGSPWHGAYPYKGAISPVWAVLAPPADLPEREAREGKSKWGSATTRNGTAFVGLTETEGWGYTGTVGAVPDDSIVTKSARFRRSRETTAATRAEFESEGRTVWKELEEMRLDWERRLQGSSAKK